jgi:cytochrome c biogenesis protein CcdA/peroxiredoxin
MELTLGLAFIAGLVSFISPCVLPLVPAYVGYMGGHVTNTVAASLRMNTPQPKSVGQRFGTAIHGLFFVAGFTFVFVMIGLLSTAFIQEIGGSNINQVTALLGRIGGVVIVIFGLHFMGALARLFARLRADESLLASPLFSVGIGLAASIMITWGLTGTLVLWSTPLWESNAWLPTFATVLLAALWLTLILGGAFTRSAAFWINALTRVETALYSDTRHQMNATNSKGLGGSALMGVVFAAGWTPCIGPVYGAVLTLAASGGDVSRSGILLVAYSLGLGVPFLFTALMLDQTQGLLRRLQRHMRTIELASGTFLIVIGLMVASGRLQDLSAQFAGDFAEFSIGLEEQAVDLVGGETSTIPATDDIRPLKAEAAPEPARAELSIHEVGLEVGNRAPDFQTVTDSVETITLSDLRGQIVLLNFWATWCGPCRVEMPVFQEQYDARAGDGFTILAVNNAESPEVVRNFRAEFSLTFPLALDQSVAIQTQYGLFSYPTTLLLDRNGVIVARHFGPLTAEQIKQLIDSALTS